MNENERNWTNCITGSCKCIEQDENVEASTCYPWDWRDSPEEGSLKQPLLLLKFLLKFLLDLW